MFATKPDTFQHSTTKRNVTLKGAVHAVAQVAKSLLSHLALVSLLLHQFIAATAFAENLPITPDGSTNTQVTHTASGIDQVNIAAPNGSGLSHNKFTDYNINQSGQVINNFSGRNPAEVVAISGTDAVTSTQIGGLVTANPNLASSGSAAIILNEVTSTNNSQLLGYAEIAGTRAELIISNPNGITCSGCGFINTSRLSLIAGSSSLDQNGNLGFALKEQANPNLMIPLITVEGLGLDVERATHADIVASAIKLIATIYGSENTDVTLKVGEGGYNYASKNIDSNSTASGELFAIDASNLGAIQAGRIFIIATKEGFGVKLDARLTATKILNIDTAGNLYYTSLNSRDQVNIKAKNIYSNNLDSAIRAAAIKVSASTEFKNLGRLTASKINISNSNIFNNLGVTEALNLDISGVSEVINSGTIFAKNSLGFSAVNLTNKSSGIIYSTADYNLDASNLLTNSGVIYSPSNLTSNSGNIINSGSIFAEENLTLNLTGGLTNSGDVQSNGNFSLTAASLDNSRSIKSFAKSTINVAAISNNVDAVIFSQGDAAILQNNLLSNYGHILSAAQLNLDGKVLGNSGEIYSAGDLDFSLTTSLNNSGSLSALAGLTLKGASTITNSGQILSGGVFTITATALTNSNKIQSAHNLMLNLQNLTNSKSILAQNIFAINGASNVNNNGGLIQSGEGFSINSSAISNELGQFISSATIVLNLGANNYSVTGNILAKNIEIKAANISNLGNVNAVEYLKLTASSGNIINGLASSSASNVKLVAGTYLELTAQNYITNYTIISAQTNLTLSATNADINNYGQVTGGSGATTLNAIAINNYKSGNASFSSKITAKNDIFLNAVSLVNNSKIESANNLSANIAADLTNNSGGFIYANNALTFNIKNNFTNNRTGVIQSLKSLTIQGQTPNSKLNQFQNISANIESLQGDITIFAKEFFNKRAVQDLEIITLIKTAANKIWYEDRFEVYDNSHPGDNLYRTDRSNHWGWMWFDFSQPNLPYRESYRYDIFAGDSNGNGIIKTVATRREAGSTNLDSVIKAGGMFTAYSDNFTNQNGQILAVGNVTINAANFNNKATAIYQTINDQCVAKNGGTCYRLKINSNGTRTLIDTGGTGHIFSFEAISSFISANIKSGSNLTINATNSINNGDNQGEVLKDSSLKATDNTHISDTENSETTTINPLSSYTPESAFISTIVKSVQDNGYLENIGDIAATIAAQSDLEKSTNPNSPVYESRSEFTNISTFCSISCLWARIKASQEAAQKAAASKMIDQISSQQNRFFGDAAADRKLIEKQLQQIYPTNSFQSYDSTAYINDLMNNSVKVATDLQLSPGITLTKEQIENLTKDIIWIEPINMPDGTVVLAPKVYLAKASRANILAQNSRGGATLSAKNIVISGDLLQTSLTNYGSIIAGNNLSISNIDNLTQSKNSLLTAMNDLNLSINSNLLNYGTIATTGSASNLSLTSLDGSITNKSNIASSNNLNITAAQDIKNIGAEISAVNDLSLKSLNGNILNTSVVQTNDANLLNSNSDSYQLRFGDAAASSGNIYSNLVQNASLKGGNIEIVAAKDFTNLAASVTATSDLPNSSSGNLSITANNNITIDTLKLHNHSESSWGNSENGGTSITDTLTNLASNINSSGSVNLSSGNNITITGSNLTTSENLAATAQNNITVQASQDTSYSESQSWKSGSTTSKTSTNGSESLTNNIANLTASGDISLTSGNTTNLIGAKLKSDDVTITAGNEINIFSVADQNSSWSTSSESRNFSGITGIVLGGSLIANAAPILDYIGIDAKNSSLATGSSSEKTSNLSGIVEASGNVSLTSNQDLTISGSNISGAIGSLISNQGSVNIISAVDVEKTSSSSNSSDRNSDTTGFEGSSKFADASSETTSNIASNLNFTDSLEIKTLGDASKTNTDINIKGSNITSNGDLTLASKGDILITNAVDTTLSESSSKKKNETVKNISKQMDYAERAVSANLNANNINIQSKGGITIQGSNLSTKENLIVGSFTIAQNSDGSYQKDSGGNYVTTSNSTVDNLTIKNADLKEYHYSQSSKGYVGVAGAAMRITPYVLVPVKIASSLIKDVVGEYLPSSLESTFTKLNPVMVSLDAFDKFENKLSTLKINSETETKSTKSTSYSSNINVGGSMMTNSVGNILIQGSNLSINGDLLANSLGSFTIAASQNTESDISQTSFETAGKFHSDLNLDRLNYKAGVAKEFVSAGNESNTTTLTSSNLNIGGSALVNSSDEFALLASNFITKGSAEIIAKNNLNISDGKNTQSTSSYLDKLTIDVGVQAGNAYADAAYAVVDAVEAQKKVKEAYDKLNKIEVLYEQDMASSKAVERAKYQVVLALVNSGLSLAAAMQSVSKAGTAAATSGGSGFYGSLYADITKLKSTTSSEYAQSIASNLTSGSNLALTSGTKDINITGSNISSANGDLILTTMLGNLNIKAGESTYSQSYKMNSQNLGGSFGTNGASANIGFNQAESSFDQTTYSNSQLSANSGTLSINSKQDANIIGANLLANDINLNIGGDLLLKSKQNLAESDSYSVGINLGISGNSSGVNGGSMGFNQGNGYSSRAWVDQVTSIIGTNSVTINTANNTNIVGALIANRDANGKDLGNLTLNTKSLTFSDLKNFSVSESNSFGINLSAGSNPNNPTANGSLNLSLAMQSSESSSDSKATVGKGNININNSSATQDQTSGLNRDITQVETNKRDVITSDFETSLKIDLRLLAAVGNLAMGNTKGAAANWNSYADEAARGYNIAKNAIKIPTTNLFNYTIKEDLTFSDTLYSTGKSYNLLYNLAYNPNIKSIDLAGDGVLISYSGDALEKGSDASMAEGFYDRKKDTVAINLDSNTSDSQLAGAIAHEGVHREMNLSGRIYDDSEASNKLYNSEEIAAHLVGDFVSEAWSSFQADNTSLSASIPTANIANNFYANNVMLGGEINPLLIYSPGTERTPKTVDKEFLKALEKTYGEKVIMLPDAVENNDKSRVQKANQLAQAIKDYNLKLGEKINIVTHSHGGNVVKKATQLDLGGKKIDSLVFLGAPHREDYKLNFNAFAPDATLINVYDVNDEVQNRAGASADGSMFLSVPKGFVSYVLGSTSSEKTINGFDNIKIEQTTNHEYWDQKSGIINKIPLGPMTSHGNLDTAPTWNEFVKPQLIENSIGVR